MRAARADEVLPLFLRSHIALFYAVHGLSQAAKSEQGAQYIRHYSRLPSSSSAGTAPLRSTGKSRTSHYENHSDVFFSHSSVPPPRVFAFAPCTAQYTRYQVSHSIVVFIIRLVEPKSSGVDVETTSGQFLVSYTCRGFGH